MDLLDRLLGHDAWTTRELLSICASLSDEQLDHDFDIAHRTIRATLEHIIYNIEAWVDLMRARPIRRNAGASVDRLIARLDRAAADLACTSQAISQQNAWDDRWLDPTDGKSKTFGGAIAHVITHSMHHRAQLLYMLRQLEVQNLPEGDVLSWEQQTGVDKPGPQNA